MDFDFKNKPIYKPGILDNLIVAHMDDLKAIETFIVENPHLKLVEFDIYIYGYKNLQNVNQIIMAELINILK